MNNIKAFAWGVAQVWISLGTVGLVVLPIVVLIMNHHWIGASIYFVTVLGGVMGIFAKGDGL